MKISEFSVKNPLLVNCLAFFLILIGLVSLFQIERTTFPNISFDVVTVTTHYPGASPEVMEKRIANPIEKEIKRVSQIKEYGSVCLEGYSMQFVTIDPDAPNKDRVVNEIQRAIDSVTDLPQDLKERPRVLELQTRDEPLVEVSLSGDLPEKELRQLAKDLETEILDMDEVSSVARKGMRDQEILVEVNPQKMASYEIALQHVMTALSARNTNMAGGVLKGKEKELILRTSGEFSNADDIRKVLLRANEGGNWVQVGDVAEVKEGFEEGQIIQRTDGSRAIDLMIIKKDKADAIRLMEDLQKVVAAFQAKSSPEIQKALKIGFVNDISYYIKRRLNTLVQNGWIGAILVMASMVFFLSPGIATGAFIGMLVALLTAFAAMKLLGMSINLISMFGIIMVLGMLVDEDLVVADNITRYLEEGYSHEEASIKGAAEVEGAIISTVLTTIIAFLPLLFMSGIFGKFIGDIPKVVIITLVASLIEALIILPSHLADFTKSRNGQGYKKKKHHLLFDRFRAWYRRSLRYCLDRPVVTVVISFAFTAFVLLYGIYRIPFILFPANGIEGFFVRAEAPVGTRLEVMEEMMKPLEQMLLSLPRNELNHVATNVGLIENDPTDPFSRRGSHIGQLAVYLTPETKRSRDAIEIMEDLRKKSAGYKEFTRISFDTVNPGPPVGKPVAVRIRGEDYEKLSSLAKLYKEELNRMPGVMDVRDDYEEGKGELQVIVDEKALQQSALTYEDVALTVRQAFAGMTATKIRKTEDEIEVVVRFPENLRYDRAALESLLIPNRPGHLVPLSRVARLEQVPGISAIKHYNGRRVVTVTANIDEKKTTSVEVNAHLRKKFAHLPQENSGITFSYGGEEEDTAKSMRSLFIAFLVAQFLVFLILLVTFGSLTQTLILMFTIPFGMVGVVIGFALAGYPFSFLALLGVVGLTGIVVDGGTLIFVFMNRLRKRPGPQPLKEVIVEACSVRLRSILLTSFTTVLGVIPAAYGLGGNDPFISPMALALNWGLAFSVFFTLYTIPVLYFLVERLIAKGRSFFPLCPPKNEADPPPAEKRGVGGRAVPGDIYGTK